LRETHLRPVFFPKGSVNPVEPYTAPHGSISLGRALSLLRLANRGVATVGSMVGATDCSCGGASQMRNLACEGSFGAEAWLGSSCFPCARQQNSVLCAWMVLAVAAFSLAGGADVNARDAPDLGVSRATRCAAIVAACRGPPKLVCGVCAKSSRSRGGSWWRPADDLWMGPHWKHALQ